MRLNAQGKRRSLPLASGLSTPRSIKRIDLPPHA